MTVTVEVELSEEQIEALLAWQGTPFTGCTPIYPPPLTEPQRSLVSMKLLEPSWFPNLNAYCVTNLGKQVRAKLIDMTTPRPVDGPATLRIGGRQ